MSDIVWEDPPESTNQRGRLVRLVAELQKHPGKWAISHQGAAKNTQLASAQQRLKVLGCEAVARKQPDGTYTLYARWPAYKVVGRFIAGEAAS